MPITKTIRLGVVGCGYWGPNLIRNFRATPECSLKVVCDLDPRRLKHMQGLYPEVETTTDFAQLLNGSGLDAIVIATSVSLHHRMAKDSLLAGKHTFIEKPMATSSADCEELIRLAEERGLILMAGHTFLYSGAVRKIKQIVDAGDLGEIRYINARRLNLGLFQKDINVAWDLAPHDLSIILHIMEEMPLSVSCRGQAHVGNGVEDVTTICMNFPKKRSAIVQSSWLDPRKVREMTIVGSKRMIVYDDVAPIEKVRVFDTRVETPPHYDTFAEFQYAYHYGDSYIPYIKQDEPLRVECQHFVDCIAGRSKPLSGGRQALEMIRVLEAASESLRLNGAAVTLSRNEDHGLPGATAPARLRASPGVPPNGSAHRNGNGNGKNGNGNGNGKNGAAAKNGTNGRAARNGSTMRRKPAPEPALAGSKY